MKNDETHTKLVKTIRNFLQNCDFDIVDSEIHFDFDKDLKADFSIDVCAVFNDYLLSFECKTSKLTQANRDIAAVNHQLQKIIDLKNRNIILKSDLRKLTNRKLPKIKKFRHCYAFGENFHDNGNLKKTLKKNNMQLWDYEALQYYEKTSKILGEFTRNEILHDFNILIGTGLQREPAVEIYQGNHPLYLLGIHPGLLLNMAYVFRRANRNASAYQRIINRERLKNLTKYLQNRNLLLANTVIIAFDKELEADVNYNPRKRELTFPKSYCSAWIIDGQHRIFAFKDSKYSNWSELDNDEFKLPVVAFKDISETDQTRTFVDINYYQKRIDPILFCDLAASVKNLKYELTWTSLLVKSLNEDGPWKGMIKTSEVHRSKSISIAAFARNILLTKLLGYDSKTQKYTGPLYKYAKFDTSKSFNNEKNQKAFQKQIKLLNRFFSVIKKHTENKKSEQNKWKNTKKFGLTKATSVNAMLLVLKSMIDKKPTMDFDLESYLLPIKKMNFTNKYLLKYGRGFPAYQPIANELIRKINSNVRINFKEV